MPMNTTPQFKMSCMHDCKAFYPYTCDPKDMIYFQQYYARVKTVMDSADSN